VFEQYYPILIIFLLVGGICSAIVAITTFVGPKKANRHKYKPFECGSDEIGDTRSRFSIKFYVVAIIFIIFDIETIFLYPWATLYKEFTMAGLGGLMFAEMALFVTILGVGLAYVWKKGALEWD